MWIWHQQPANVNVHCTCAPMCALISGNQQLKACGLDMFGFTASILCGIIRLMEQKAFPGLMDAQTWEYAAYAAAMRMTEVDWA